MKKPNVYWRYYRQFSFAFSIVMFAATAVYFIVIEKDKSISTIFDILVPWVLLIWVCFDALQLQSKNKRLINYNHNLADNIEQLTETYKKHLIEKDGENVHLFNENGHLKSEVAIYKEKAESASNDLSYLQAKTNIVKGEIKELKETFALAEAASKVTQQNLDNCKKLCEDLKTKNNTLQQKLQQMEADKNIYEDDISKQSEAQVSKLKAAHAKEIKEIKNFYKQKMIKRDLEVTELLANIFVINESNRRYFRHYKGGVYRLIATGSTADEKRQEVVVYESLLSGDILIKAANKFYGNIPVKAARDMGMAYKRGDILPPLYEEISKEDAEYIAANWNGGSEARSPQEEQPAEPVREETKEAEDAEA